MSDKRAIELTVEAHIVLAQVVPAGTYACQGRCRFPRSALPDQKYAFTLASDQAGMNHLNVLIVVPLQEKPGERLGSFVDKDSIVPYDRGNDVARFAIQTGMGVRQPLRDITPTSGVNRNFGPLQIIPVYSSMTIPVRHGFVPYLNGQLRGSRIQVLNPQMRKWTDNMLCEFRSHNTHTDPLSGKKVEGLVKFMSIFRRGQFEFGAHVPKRDVPNETPVAPRGAKSFVTFLHVPIS